MRVLILGGSGFVGKHLSDALRSRGDEVSIASLRDPQAASRAAEGCDAIVNLAGEPLGQRWNAQVKRKILESRSLLPAAFLDGLARSVERPKVYVSASAVGYYGTSDTTTFTEASPPGNDFLAQVCTEWERSAQRARDLGMRAACIRTGLALGREGALPRLLPIFKAGTGGKVGSGRQWHSWIHVDDLIGIYLTALDGIDGALNATSPNPVTNEEFTQTLAGVLHRPAALPVPAFALRLALGEGATVLLEGQRVLPERTQREGFSFKFEQLKEAFADLL